MLVMAESTNNKRKWIGVDEGPDIDNEVEHDEDKTVTKIWFPCFSSCFFFVRCLFSGCVCFKDANSSSTTSSVESGSATASSSSGADNATSAAALTREQRVHIQYVCMCNFRFLIYLCVCVCV